MTNLSECIKKSLPIIEPNVVVGEGVDEKNFFDCFIEHVGLTRIEVRGIGGKTQLEENLRTLKITTGFNKVRTLGVTRDADDDYAGAFASVQNALRNVGLAVPREPLTLVGRNPRILVLILPRPNQNGMLEDLCLEAVQGDPAMPCVNTFFGCIEENVPIQPRNLSKAKVHAFLSTRIEEHSRLGLAAKKKYWPFNSGVFDVIREFLGIILS